LALDGPLVVDVALARKPSVARNERVAIQLETPDMFAANPPHAALGPTAARWRALQLRGWQVGRMFVGTIVLQCVRGFVGLRDCRVVVRAWVMLVWAFVNNHCTRSCLLLAVHLLR
jgi:hypothetical protein